MSSLIIFDPNTTPNKVLSYLPSNVDPAAYQGRSDVLVDASLSNVAGLPMRHWKHVSGAIVAQTTAEQNTTDAAITAAFISDLHTFGKNALAAQDALGILERAFADIVKDEINALRQWIVAFKAATAASTSLANLQMRVAALSDMPDRTLAQLKTAIQNRIDGGTVDS